MADEINELVNRAEEFMTKAPYLPLGLAKEMIAALKEQESEKKCCADCEYYGACHSGQGEEA